MINSTNLLKGFVVFGILYSMVLLTGNDLLAWYLKPFLIPFLFYAVVKSEKIETKKWLLSALLFSWIGDCILLFADKSELYFIFGLVSFLIAHILFIVLFVKQNAENRNFKKPLFWVGCIGVLLYLAKMLSQLLPTLGDLKVPVSIYALTISIMVVMALKGAFNWQNNSKYTVLMGAVFFVISDSILALNKFDAPIPLATFWIMVTYLIAQFCITFGILKLNRK